MKTLLLLMWILGIILIYLLQIKAGIWNNCWPKRTNWTDKEFVNQRRWETVSLAVKTVFWPVFMIFYLLILSIQEIMKKSKEEGI